MRSMADQNLGETLAKPGESRIHLCGRFTVRIDGDRLEEGLPGRQGRMLFAFLVLRRLRATPRAFLPGYDARWIAEERRKLEDVLVRAHECVAASGLGLGGPELAAAERSARQLIELAPFRESGYRFLMQALALRDNTGEALLVYEELRRVLREELGASPGAATQALQRRILQGQARAGH